MATTYFDVGAETISRNDALWELIAATYRAARASEVFTTDNVYNCVNRYNPHAFRVGIAASKLASVALRKAKILGMCEPLDTTLPGDKVCHGRRKRAWRSLIARTV